MSHPFAPGDDVADDIDWDSFLNMDIVIEPSDHENMQVEHGTETEPLFLGGIATAAGGTDAGDTFMSFQPPVRGASVNSTIDPYVCPPSRQMHTIDEVVTMLHGSRSLFDPGEMNDADALDRREEQHSGPPPVEAGASKSGAGGYDDSTLPPLGAFLQHSLPKPCMIDPALTGDTLSCPQSIVGKIDEETQWPNRTLDDSSTEHQLRNSLFKINNSNETPSRNLPTQHNSPDYPYPPPNSPELSFSPLPSRHFTNNHVTQAAPPFSELPFSALPPNIPRQRTRPKSNSRARSASFTPQPDIKGPCLTCGKNYRTSSSPGRCSRCGIKWERHTAGPPIYTLDPSIPDLNTAREMLFPVSRVGRGVDDDLHSILFEPGIEDVWVQRWLDALNTPVESEGDGEGVKASWATNQQTTFNQKAKMDREGEYSPSFVTARLRALWWEVVIFHGGGRGFYPVGGDSAGYSEDTSLKFGERLEAVRAVMQVDKRTVMDVVEGRGIGGFVSNPWGFHKRKDSNNGCNVKKKDVLKRHRGDTGTSERGRGGKGRGGRKRTSRASSAGASRASSVREEDRDDERWSEDEGDVDVHGGPVETVE